MYCHTAFTTLTHHVIQQNEKICPIENPKPHEFFNDAKNKSIRMEIGELDEITLCQL